jgi:hypothetical protein
MEFLKLPKKQIGSGCGGLIFYHMAAFLGKKTGALRNRILEAGRVDYSGRTGRFVPVVRPKLWQADALADATISHFTSQGAVDEAITRTIDNDCDLRSKRDLLLSISGVGETLARSCGRI